MSTKSDKKQTPKPKKEPTEEQKKRSARFVANGSEDW